ncbi:MAG: glycoside hydrolase family 1 protein [Propioniciclava sp.]
MEYRSDQITPFPADFLWGAASSAFQVEGAAELDGKKLSTVDLNTRRKPGRASSDVAADHYHRFREDVALMAEAGFSSYRCSLSWPRLLPDGAGAVNGQGVAFYHQLIDELLAHQITPIVTLFHYDLPLALQEKYRGWHSRQVIDDFAEYCRLVFTEYGDKVPYFLTLNEQNMQIVYGDWLGLADRGVEDFRRSQWQINHIMNLCHATAVRLCRELAPAAKIGPVPGYVPLYPASPRPEDVLAALNADEVTQKFWLDTWVHGEYSTFQWKYMTDRGLAPEIVDGDLELMKSAPVDFIAINNYRSNVAAHCGLDEEPRAIGLNKDGVPGQFVYPKVPGVFQQTVNPHLAMTDWDWEIDPMGLRFSLRDVYNHYRLPLMITENGFGAYDTLSPDGTVHDPYRIEYLKACIEQVQLAITDGVPVFSYNPWSFTDLISTGNGISKRYGLVYVDRDEDDLRTLDRIRKDSFFWYQRVVTSHGREGLWE